MKTVHSLPKVFQFQEAEATPAQIDFVGPGQTRVFPTVLHPLSVIAFQPAFTVVHEADLLLDLLSGGARSPTRRQQPV